MTTEQTPWGREGLNRSQWLRRYRAAINMALQSLSDPSARAMTAQQLIGHIRSKSVAAPNEIYAIALRQAATHIKTEGPNNLAYVVRLNQAALLAEAGGQGEAPPPPRGAVLRERMQSIVAPIESKPYRLFDVYSNCLTNVWIDPRTGEPLDPQTEARQAPGP